MIVQALKARFGPDSRPIADSDYIRFTSPATGDRLVYRTPPDAAAALISFDAGIPPPLPLHIRARIAYQRRQRMPANEARVCDVRAWARADPRFPGVSRTGTLSDEVITAFKAAHPDKTVVRQGAHTVSTSASNTLPKTIVPRGSNGSLPRVGNLAGGTIKTNIPASRRRTWGSRQLTAVLVEQGWAAPAEPGK
jgi:hypothetical protein